MRNEKTVPYNLRLPDPLKKRLEKLAKEQKRSLNKHLIYILERAANESRDKAPATV